LLAQRASGAFDAVIDFDKILQDPANPNRMLPKWDSGDHLHPGDAGYRYMGDSIDLKLFDR
jgi:lysophospholipase L1-like esterase